MAASAPFLSKSEVDRAGEIFRHAYRGKRLPSGQVLMEAYDTISRYRDLHAYPLKKVTLGVSYYIRQVRGDDSIRAVQRFKRMDRIISKLARLTTRLSQMEDIGGCRAVLASQEEVYAVADRILHRWRDATPVDYIAKPKDSGYRAFHVIERRDGRLIEVQLRTLLQHQWARAVETWVRPVVDFNLKDGEGPDEVQDYFRLAAELLSLVDRGESPDDELRHTVTAFGERIVQTYGARTG